MKIAIIRPFPGVVPLQPGKIGIAQCPHDMRILRLRPKCFGTGLHTGRNRPVIQPIKGNALPESVKPAVLSNHRFPAFSADPDCRGSPAGRICNGHAAQRDPAGGIGKHQGQNRLFTDPDAIKYGIFDSQTDADFRCSPCQQFAAGSTDASAETSSPATYIPPPAHWSPHWKNSRQDRSDRRTTRYDPSRPARTTPAQRSAEQNSCRSPNRRNRSAGYPRT